LKLILATVPKGNVNQFSTDWANLYFRKVFRPSDAIIFVRVNTLSVVYVGMFRETVDSFRVFVIIARVSKRTTNKLRSSVNIAVFVFR
jgi:hypothetical protein